MDKSEHLYTGGRKVYLGKNRDKLRAQERARYAKNAKLGAAKKRAWRNANIEKFNRWQRQRYAANPEYYRSRSRRYLQIHSNEVRARTKLRRAKKRDELREYYRNYRNKNIDKIRASIGRKTKERYWSDPLFRLEKLIRNRVRSVIKTRRINKPTEKIVGCSIPDLIIYLESKFEIGMTWDNYGRGNGKWHVDHVMPCAIFDLSKPEHRKRCFHFSNLQPLWEPENLRKHDSVKDNQFLLL